MKTYTDEKLQAAIDNAILLFGKENGKSWEQLADNRLAIAKTFLEKLEPADPYAELKKAHAEGKVIQWQSMGEGPWGDYDPRYNAEPGRYESVKWRIKPEPSTFEAHGKTWTRHTPEDPMPCDGERMIEWLTQGELDGSREFKSNHYRLAKTLEGCWGIVRAWRYADEQPKPETPVWTPAVGDVVQLKSGSPKMTIHFLDAKNAGCVTFSNTGEFTFATLPQACLTQVTE